MDICHLTLTAERPGRLPLFPDAPRYLEALRRLGAACKGCLALFALLAEHLHLVAPITRAAGGRMSQAVISALHSVVATPLASGYPTMVESRDHLRHLLRYILRQPIKHHMPGHPALWIGSCLPDLLGARMIDGLSLCVKRVLPDTTDGQALAIVGLSGHQLVAADRQTLRAVGAHRLRLAAAAAFGVDPELAGNDRAPVMARRAVVQIAQRVGIHSAEVIAALGRSRRTLWRLRRPALEDAVLKVVARRVTLENWVQQALAAAPVTQLPR